MRKYIGNRTFRFLFILVLAQCALAERPKGQIIGTVINDQGEPVPGAQVSPRLKGVYVTHEAVIIVKTDIHGRFSIDGLDWGSYFLYAGKVSDGYPDTRAALYRNAPVPEVRIAPSLPVGHATIVIGPKGGIFAASV